MTDWLEIHRGQAPLVVAFPHTGWDIPADLEARFVSLWLARKDADWRIEQLYAFARDLGATTIRTRISRSVIDVNRDPSGASLYPGQTTTGLCPLETFDGEPLYNAGDEPEEQEIARRRETYFAPYHVALRAELERLRAANGCVVLYDAHSIRSYVPRLFDGELPHFNIGTNHGETCALALRDAITNIAAESELSHVVDGRFRGGWTTRHYGQPQNGVHAIQMELAMRGYIVESANIDENNWPPTFSARRAADLTIHLKHMLEACIYFATTNGTQQP